MSFINSFRSEMEMAGRLMNTLVEKIEQGFLKIFYLYKKRFITPKGIEAMVLLLVGVKAGILLFHLRPDECRPIRTIAEQLTHTALENYRTLTQVMITVITFRSIKIRAE